MIHKDFITHYFKDRKDSRVRFIKYRRNFFILKNNVLQAATKISTKDSFYECQKLVDTLNLSYDLKFNKAYRKDVFVDVDLLNKLGKD